MSNNISNSVIRRLPRYYRFLEELKAEGKTRVSSEQLSAIMRLTASQIRQDFNCFGGFGQQGYGYNIEVLHEEIGRILGIEKKKSAIIIGIGNIGKAIAQNMNFESKGFTLIGLFDSKESLVGQMVRNAPIRSIRTLDEFCRENHPELAVICTPKDSAKEICETLYSLGTRAFLNFSHFDILSLFPDAKVENIHFGDSLMTLSYRLNE